MTATRYMDAVLAGERQWTVEAGDCRDLLKLLPDESVQCVVTSPPYWGLRDYGVAGQVGLEPSPQEYVAQMVAIFREVRRVLRSDGTCWLNLGDTYFGSGGAGGDYAEGGLKAGQPKFKAGRESGGVLKPKDLIGVPWEVALALRNDGWWLRSDIVWAKPNPMPESVTDRPVKAHEYIFLLAKSGRYFFDCDAVAEKSARVWQISASDRVQRVLATGGALTGGTGNGTGEHDTRSLRSVWTVATHPFSQAHFATFPPKLIEPCIKAGTSEKGQCEACGKPWVRVTERRRATYERTSDPTMLTGRAGFNRPRPGLSERYVLGVPQPELARMLKDAANGRTTEMEKRYGSKWAHWTRTDASGARIPTPEDAADIYATLGVRVPFTDTAEGWEPQCSCDAPAVPQVVLDPFNGAGTSGLVATRLDRRYIGLELNPDYAVMARNRIYGDAPLLQMQEQV